MRRDTARERTPQRPEMTWYRIDMHLHTPASSDYRDPDATYLQILQKAEARAGYYRLHRP